MRIVGIIFLILNFYLSSSQSLFLERFKIGASAGLAIPVGAFGNKHPDFKEIRRETNLQRVTFERYFTYLEGYGKREAAFAKLGFNYEVEISFDLTKRIELISLFNSVNNSVDNDAATQFLQKASTYRQHFQNDYNFHHFAFGTGYKISRKKTEISAQALLGYGTINFPTFSMLWARISVFQYDDYVKIPEKLNNFGYVLRVNSVFWINKQIGIQASTSFLSYNFDYILPMRTIPGGSDNTVLVDTIIYRNLLLNAGIAFRLSK